MPRLFVIAHGPDGGGEIISTSPDAVTWTERASPLVDNGHSAAFGAGLYVVGTVGISTTESLESSPDGVTWTLRSSPADTFDVATLIYAGGKFVALVDAAGVFSVMTSPNGITWTSHSIPSGSTSWRALAFSPSLHLYVAVSDGGAANGVMTSPDAVTWTDQTSPAFVGNCIAWGAGLFVALGGIDPNLDPTTKHLMTSPDGVTWTIQTNPGDQVWFGVVYAAGKFVACGRGFTIPDQFKRFMSSTDGLTWTIFTQAFRRQWWAITYGLGLYVAVANDDDTGDPGSTAIATSPDGATWTQRATNTVPTFCRGICYPAVVGNYIDGPGQGGNQTF